jgi:hypothetical protein
MNQEVEEEEIGLTSEDLEKLQLILDNHLKGQVYEDMNSGQVINDVLEDIIAALHAINKPYKYITNLMLSQRMGTGLSNYTAAYWDKTYDFVYHIFYPKDKSFTTGGKERAMIFGLLTIGCVSFKNNDNKII